MINISCNDVICNHDPQSVDLACADGRLRPVIGVHNIQVLRANRENPDQAEGYGWTYNHQPYLAYWNNAFYLEYLSNSVAEHEGPGQTLMATSKDGFNWSKPQVVFPVYEVTPGQYSVMHQRMGFYVSKTDRLLILAFYGPHCKYPWPPVWDGPNNGNGIGRVVREVYRDGSLGPVYFIRYNRHAGWHEANTHYPFYQSAPDQGFVDACEELLANKLATQQWWEEDQAEDGFFAISGQKAFCCYHRQDGKTVGLWKFAKASLSSDDGQTWLPVTEIPTFQTGGQKMWGQCTADGRYAVVYTPHTSIRWPLAIATGEDGTAFDHLLAVHGEVSPMRYSGFCKNQGPQYVRGIAEGNGQPDAESLWLTYSMNKEDIFVSRVTLPVKYKVEGPVRDSFEGLPLGSWIENWNIYAGLWTPIQVVVEPDTGNQCLELRDRDPYDYSQAARVFPESEKARLQFKVKAAQTEWGWLEIDVVNAAAPPARPDHPG